MGRIRRAIFVRVSNRHRTTRPLSVAADRQGGNAMAAEAPSRRNDAVSVRTPVSPQGMRETRDLLRRRTFLVRRRAELLAHLVNTNCQYNLPPLSQKLCYAANRAALDLPRRFADPSVQ